jgi:hypothetical protein
MRNAGDAGLDVTLLGAGRLIQTERLGEVPIVAPYTRRPHGPCTPYGASPSPDGRLRKRLPWSWTEVGHGVGHP